VGGCSRPRVQSKRMQRRTALELLTGLILRAGTARSLDRFLPPSSGSALLVDARTRQLIAASGPEIAGRSVLPPGSTLKPFVLAALLNSGRLREGASYLCPGRLRIGGRMLDCSHPKLALPVQIDTALAYSCNCFVARAAEGFAPGEFARELTALGFASPSGLLSNSEVGGRIHPANSVDEQKLQVLGEARVEITLAELASAYCRLAAKIARPELRPIRAGLEECVEFGTAQNAKLTDIQVAGKTGSVLTPVGEPIAWFAGFLPSTAPEILVTVMLRGRSGGADAAPIAREILMAYRAGKL
jgi:penicillin-binding protein A